MILKHFGAFQNGSGTIQNHWGMCQNDFGAFQNDSGMIQNHWGMCQNDFGMFQNNFGMIQNYSGLRQCDFGTNQNDSSPLRWVRGRWLGDLNCCRDGWGSVSLRATRLAIIVEYKLPLNRRKFFYGLRFFDRRMWVRTGGAALRM